MVDSQLIRCQSLPATCDCPVCTAGEVAVIMEISQIPVHCNLLWPSREKAVQAPRGDLRLGFCRACGHIFNLAFRSDLMAYDAPYENSLHFSPHFQAFAENLAQQLIDRFGLYGKNIIEIGCGQGEFLKLLCALGGNRGVGFDPSYRSKEMDEVPAQDITFIRAFYSERYASYKADLICARHVLEHIEHPRAFLDSIRSAIGSSLRTAVYFEVPNVLFTLRDLGIWDLIYEHRSYFSSCSLRQLFASTGFDVCHLNDAYDGQFIGVDGWPGHGSCEALNDHERQLEQLSGLVKTFVSAYENKLSSCRSMLERMASAGRRTVIWGGGSKGVTFLNMLKIEDLITYVVDINHRKQGMYVAGTGQEIVSPGFLRQYRPDAILIMNPIYHGEIRDQLRELELQVELICV
jgi:hypothetical protein